VGVSEGVACATVRVERVGLTAVAVQREHELSPYPLSEGVLRHDRLELADDLAVAAEREVGLEPILERVLVQARQPGGLGDRPGLVRELGEGIAAPERQRLAQRLGGSSRVAAAERRPRLRGEPLERDRVDRRLVQLERVPGRARDEEPGPEDAPKSGDVVLQSVRCIDWRVVAPQLLDQPVGGDDATRVGREESDDRALLRTRDLDDRVAVADLERAEHGQAQRTPHDLRPGPMLLSPDDPALLGRRAAARRQGALRA
jgi:hypothetical protein